MSESELENRQVEKDETAAQAIGERNRRENRQAQAPRASRSDESDAGGSNEAGPSTSAQVIVFICFYWTPKGKRSFESKTKESDNLANKYVCIFLTL